MSLWEEYLIAQVCRLYKLSAKEQEVLLTKFPNEESFITNNDVAELSLENNQLPYNTETVDKHMRNIYEKLGLPEKCEAFPGYNEKRGQARDPVFLTWIKPKYLEWKKNRIELQPSPQLDNPFIPRNGMIDNPQLFFGRAREIRNIFEMLKGGSSVALIGERGIGKSSLLMEICRQAENQFGQTRKPIYVNLQNVHDEDDFYEALCSLVGVQTNKGYLLERALKPHRILLILDEVEKMTWDGFTNNVRGQLRGLADGIDPPLRLVVAACSPLDVLFPDSQDKNMTSPFKGICLEENLDLWDKIICRNFIDSRLNASWLKLVTNPVSFTEEEIAQLIAESGGHPQKLMQLCYRTYAGYLEEIQ